MSGVFAADGRIWGTLDLAREGGRSDFDPSEAALLRHLAPHVSAGLKLAVLRSQAPPETAGDGVPGVLVLDRRGKILHHTASAERWLRDLGDLGPGWREGVGLPAAVWTVVSALRRTLKPETERDRSSSVLRLRVRSRSGQWLTFLSPREREVVDLVARAASTREISQTLFISEYTVQEPLSNVFEKVGVRSRRELVKRFYFDAMYS
jgi:DNA-binding CsgD family transcriptional regulator